MQVQQVSSASLGDRRMALCAAPSGGQPTITSTTYQVVDTDHHVAARNDESERVDEHVTHGERQPEFCPPPQRNIRSTRPAPRQHHASTTPASHQQHSQGTRKGVRKGVRKGAQSARETRGELCATPLKCIALHCGESQTWLQLGEAGNSSETCCHQHPARLRSAPYRDGIYVCRCAGVQEGRRADVMRASLSR